MWHKILHFFLRNMLCPNCGTEHLLLFMSTNVNQSASKVREIAEVFQYKQNCWSSSSLWSTSEPHTMTTMTTITRHTASTSTYSLTFCVRVTTPTVWTKWNGARSRRINVIAGKGSQSLPACVVRAACSVPGGLLLGSATHFNSVAIATQPVHRLRIRQIVHN